MQKFSVRHITLIGILGIFTGIILWIQYRHPVEKVNVDIFKIPLNVGEWKGENILVDEGTKDILETEGVLMRKYTNPKGEEVVLAIVYYKDSRVALHLPEGCYTGKGSHIVERGVAKVNISESESFYTNKLVLKGDKGDQIILYYFETGILRTNSYLILRWQMMKNKLMAKSNSGALVRFSTSFGDNQAKNLERLKEFIKELALILPRYLI